MACQSRKWTKELTKEYKPYGLYQNKEMAKRGGRIANNTRNDLEKELGRSIISKENNINGKYVDTLDNKNVIEHKKSNWLLINYFFGNYKEWIKLLYLEI